MNLIKKIPFTFTNNVSVSKGIVCVVCLTVEGRGYNSIASLTPSLHLLSIVHKTVKDFYFFI